jgi:hypothetical protein
MRKLTILVMTLGLLIWAGTTAQAASSGAVAVTTSIGLSLSMTLSANTWAAGSMAINETKSTWASGTQGFFTVTNNANGPEYMDIAAAVTTGDCTLGTAAGANIYRIGYGQATTTSASYDTEASYTAIGAEANLATIAAGDTYKFDLQLMSPTSTIYGGVTQVITVTITAKTA